MGNNKLQLPTKTNMFYSEDDFIFETEMVEGYIEEDLNQSVVLYEVDRRKTNVNAIYKEATSGNIRYKTQKKYLVYMKLKILKQNHLIVRVLTVFTHKMVI